MPLRLLQRSLFTLLILFFAQLSFAQGIVRGQLIDGKDKSPVIGASVLLISDVDSTQRKGAITDENGRFQIRAGAGIHTLRTQAVGYKSYTRKIQVQDSAIGLGT